MNLAWLFRAIAEESTRFFWLAVIGATVFALVALSSFGWIFWALNHLKEDNP